MFWIISPSRFTTFPKFTFVKLASLPLRKMVKFICQCPINNYKLKHMGCEHHKIRPEIDQDGSTIMYNAMGTHVFLPTCSCGVAHLAHDDSIVVQSQPIGQPLSATVLLGKACCEICNTPNLVSGRYSRAWDYAHCHDCHELYRDDFAYPCVLWFHFEPLREGRGKKNNGC